MPGVTITVLAAATGSNCFEVALGLAAVLGAIAGPFAGPQGMVGDILAPAFHLIAAAKHSGCWHRLEELLFGPVDACQRRLRDLSRATTTARLDYMEFSRLNDHTDEVVEMTKPAMYKDVGVPSVPAYPQQNIAMFRTPTFFLRTPSDATWVKAQPEILNANVFVWDDGTILQHLRAARSTKDPASSSRALIAAAVGCERYIVRAKQVGPGRLDPVKAHLFISTSRDEVADTLASEDPDLRRFLQTCLFVVPSRSPCKITLQPAVMRAGYEAYCVAVDKVVGARRNGDGLRFALNETLSTEIEKSAESIRNWCHGLPPRLQPFFAHTVSLPYRIVWACLATLGFGEDSRWVAPFVRAAVKHVLIMQQKFLEEQIQAAEVAQQQRAREVMLQKLASIAPCPVRELLRRYSRQRLELHQPVLDALISDGRVRQRDDGHLELIAANPVGV